MQLQRCMHIMAYFDGPMFSRMQTAMEMLSRPWSFFFPACALHRKEGFVRLKPYQQRSVCLY